MGGMGNAACGNFPLFLIVSVSRFWAASRQEAEAAADDRWALQRALAYWPGTRWPAPSRSISAASEAIGRGARVTCPRIGRYRVPEPPPRRASHSRERRRKSQTRSVS
jgi:hypothetical protein